MRIWFALFFVAFTAPARATVPAELSYFTDDAATMKIEDVLGRAKTLPWVASRRTDPSFGLSTGRIWLRVKPTGLRYAGLQPILFEIDDAYIGRIAFYRVLNGKVVQRLEAGTAVSFRDRPLDVISTIFTAFRVPAPFDPDSEYYLSIEGENPLSFPLRVWEGPSYNSHIWHMAMVVGLYLGCLILAVITNLVIGISLRNRLYLLYAGYVTTVIFFSLSATGLSPQLFWPDSPWWSSHEVIVYGFPALALYVAFLRGFLDVRRVSRVLDALILACVAIMGVRTVWLVFAPQQMVNQIGVTASMVSNVLVIPVAWLAVRNGTRGARLFYASSLCFNVAIVVFTLQLMGAIDVGEVGLWLPFIGLLIEVVLLSLALADRIRQANREIAAQKMAMVQSEKIAALGRMAGEIAHEISNPLAIIHGNAVLIKKAPSAPEVESFAEMIENTANRITTVVRGMRALSRDTRRDPFQSVPFDSVLRDAFSLCRDTARNRGVTIEIPEPDPALQLRCRGAEISQVLVNLLSNGMDALEGRESRRIHVDVSRRGSFAVITVSDDGPGVPKELREQILEPFFTTKEPGRGLGLGLSISRTIVENHGGKLWLEESGAGARFLFTIPFWIQ